MLQSFDELYVISDLHLGGNTGFQIFNQGATLAAFIKGLTGKPASRRVGLVLNGDTVDFLAEAGTEYLDPQGAVQKFRRILLEDTSFSGVFLALQEFVAAPNRNLIIVLGNHDVELGLPEMKEWLLENISNKKQEARSRVTMCYDGAGFACDVGGKRVFCIHGNDVDVWNFVDQKQLRELALSLNFGKTPPEWDANAGTRLVIDVMNSIKHRYPIVDLLKPEVEAVVPILLCLKPDCYKEVSRIMTVAAHLSRDAILRSIGFLSAEEEIKDISVQKEEVMSQFATRYFNYNAAKFMSAESLINSAYESLDVEKKQQGAKDKTVPQSSDEEQFLSPIDYIRALFGKEENKAENLRKALEKNLQEDQTFEITHQDQTFIDIDKQAGPNVHFLITGHTHLERAIARSTPGCYYYNSGTWIRLIQLTYDILNNSDEFARVYKAFESGTMEELDSIKDLGPKRNQPMVLSRPTVVSIIAKDGDTFGELHHVQTDGSLQPVENSKYPRR
ncbi:MAG: metallophosphoesterase [Smithella sp.]